MSTFQKVQKTCLRPRVPRLMSLAPLEEPVKGERKSSSRHTIPYVENTPATCLLRPLSTHDCFFFFFLYS